MKLSDESGLIEIEVKAIVIKLQKHSIKKFDANKRYTKDGIAVVSLKIVGNNNNRYPVNTKKSDLINTKVHLLYNLRKLLNKILK